jgi:hypothetical protein
MFLCCYFDNNVGSDATKDEPNAGPSAILPTLPSRGTRSRPSRSAELEFWANYSLSEPTIQSTRSLHAE